MLRCQRPGTGTVDAPRSFSLMLKSILIKLGWRETSVDSELLIHFTDKLNGVMSVHVDDIKIAAEKSLFNLTTHNLEIRSGKLTITLDNFVNTGVRHRRLPNGDIILDQHEYVKGLGQIKSEHVKRSTTSNLCNAEDHQQFRSLLGALAYASITQTWATVYIVALQRVAAAPKNEHVLRLNKLVRLVQAQGAETTFKHMTCSYKLIVHSDSSFRKEDDKGYAMRGAAYLRVGWLGNKKIVHLLLGISKSQNLVTRSTYAAELLAAASATDNSTLFIHYSTRVH